MSKYKVHSYGPFDGPLSDIALFGSQSPKPEDVDITTLPCGVRYYRDDAGELQTKRFDSLTSALANSDQDDKTICVLFPYRDYNADLQFVIFVPDKPGSLYATVRRWFNG